MKSKPHTTLFQPTDVPPELREQYEALRMTDAEIRGVLSNPHIRSVPLQDDGDGASLPPPTNP